MGRYAGRKAAEYSRRAGEPVTEKNQVSEEKKRVYAPVSRDDGIGWKEFKAGLCRIMQDYCGEYKSERVLRRGLNWLESIKESEAATAYARNPHELVRTLECLTHITLSEMVLHASLARRASSDILGFKRLDYPKVDPGEWHKFITIKLANNGVRAGERPLGYWLLPPNSPDYEENYRQHASL
jgi:succinate dehydrogenase/fumarate reductase flavoprotein subunit